MKRSDTRPISTTCRYIDEHDRSPTRWRALGAAQPPALLFWHRQSQRRLVPHGGANIVTRVNPPDHAFRDVVADARSNRPAGQPPGRPGTDRHVAGKRLTRRRRTSASDWKPLFAEAGLPIATVLACKTAVASADLRGRASSMGGRVSRTPGCAHSDRSGGRPGEARVLRDRRAVDPAQERRALSQAARQESASVSSCARSWGRLLLVVAALLALRNLRLGRGDRRGAMRLSLFLLAAGADEQCA